ncbi:MAG: MBL fold metallo-hydrolase [Acidobacteria bacterium]|nr:MBL fold metallo-hydrolase [Acidobacteriota bacterium]
MRRVLVVLTALVVGLSSVPSAQQAGALRAAADALGAERINSLAFTAAGAAYQVGQNYTGDQPWPPVMVRQHTVVIGFGSASMRQEQVRDQSVTQPRGGGAPFNGQEQRLIQLVSGNFAWNLPAPAPAAPGAAAGGAGQGGNAALPMAAPAPANQVERMLTIWSTPQGFVKGALANNATTRRVTGGTEVTFTVAEKYRVTGVINVRNQVERVQTRNDSPVVGDMLIETEYRDYYDFGGILFPMRIVQKQDGLVSLDLIVASVTANPTVNINVPDNVRTPMPAPPVNVTVQKVAEGVFHLTGGTHHSLAVEMRDHIVLFDTPNNEQRGAAVIAKAKETIPNKPIRYIVTSHHHWDHLGGIRSAIDEGATIVTHQSNKALIERIARSRRTLNPDALERSRKPLKLQLVGAREVLTDGQRTIELHNLTNYRHAGDMLVMYLPAERIVAEADVFTPPAMPTTPLNPAAMPAARALVDNVQRLGLNVQTVVPFHGGRTVEWAEVTQRVAAANATD